jgi:thioredoxin-related protein
MTEPTRVAQHMHRPILLSSFLVALLSLCATMPARSAELLMFESAACPYCEEWNKVIGPIYPKTSEARVARLRRVDIHAKRPAELTGIRGIVYTPTFVLWHDGKEYGRITGYPGEDFFWGLLAELIRKLPETARAPDRATGK